MSSSPPQGNATLSLPSSASSERPQIFIEGQHVLSQLEHTASLGRMSSKPGDVPTIARGLVAIELEPAKLLSPLGHRTTRKVAADIDHGQGDTSDARSVSSRRSSRFGIRKRLSKLFKGDKKVIETASASQTSSTSPIVSTVPLQPSPAASGTIRLDIFLENVAEPTYKTDLPKQLTRVDKTLQLVYCCSLISKAQEPLPSTSDSDVSQDSPLDDREKEWVQLVDPVLQDRYRWLVEHLVKSFAENPLKASDVVTEIVLVGPVLDRDTYRSLLSCFISKFEQTTALDITLLQGLVQLVESASAGYLVDDDLVRIATVLSKELLITHIGTSNHPLHLTLSLARVLDVMVAGKVKDLNRERDHQPMMQLLDGLKDSDNIVQ
ncbi:hypothetical protein BGZ91_007783, partial [Linnemannia elongata]